jgi:hypothetical protein
MPFNAAEHGIRARATSYSNSSEMRECRLDRERRSVAASVEPAA